MNDSINKLSRQILITAAICYQTVATSLGNVNTEIVIPIHNWESHQVVAHVTGKLLTKVGYTVRFVYQNPEESFTSINKGTITIDPEVWPIGENAQHYLDALGQGGIVSAGDHIATAQFGWWVPDETIALCPTLPNWHGLNQCFRKFSRDGDADKGVYFTTQNPENHMDFINQYRLRFKPNILPNTEALQNEIKTAYKRNKAIAIFNWGPGPHHAKLKGKFVEFPHQPTHWLTKICHYQLPINQPAAYRLLQQIQLTNADIIEMTSNMEELDLAPSIAARMWLRDHPDRWEKWLKNLQLIPEDSNE